MSRRPASTKIFTGGLACGLILAAATWGLWSLRRGPRGRLLELLAISEPFAWTGSEIEETRALPEGRLQRIAFSGESGGIIRAWLLIPKASPPPGGFPAVLLLHGHFSSAQDSIGLTSGKPGRAIGRELAARGFAVLAPQARHEYQDMKEETRQALGLLAHGKTLMGERVADVLRHIDTLRFHHDVDDRKIAILGRSMGGVAGLYATALDPGIRAAYISGGFGSVERMTRGDLQSPDNYVPGIIPFGDLLKVASMICPRPLFIEALREDNSLPVAGVEEFEPKLRQACGAPSDSDRLRIVVYPGAHRWVGQEAADWLAGQLAGG